MNASKIQSQISKFCAERNVLYNNLVTMSKAGWPDVMIVSNGITYYFEIKYGKDTLKPLQKYIIDKLNKHSKIAFIAKTFQEFKQIYRDEIASKQFK